MLSSETVAFINVLFCHRCLSNKLKKSHKTKRFAINHLTHFLNT